MNLTSDPSAFPATSRAKTYRGVFAIPPTPFHEDLSLDMAGLERVVEFCLKTGSSGIVFNANASESAYLSTEERNVVGRAIAKCVNGAVPLVAGVSSSCANISIDLAHVAADLGADAIMAMPPTHQKPSESEILSYFERLGDATKLPIFVQNWGGPGGTPMSTKLVLKIVTDNENCRYVKEETEFSSEVISELVEGLSGNEKVIMGGKSGRRMLDEFARGACGTMPAAEVTDVQAAIWRLLEAGQAEEAHAIYEKLLPFLVAEMGYGANIYKTVLMLRGVIKCPACRQTGGRKLDARTVAHVSELLWRVSDYFHQDYMMDKPER